MSAAGPLGIAQWLAGLAYANRNLTDGFIPRGIAKRLLDWDGIAWRMWSGELMGGGEDAEALDVSEHLVVVGLWESADGGYRIHDYHDYQPSAAEVREQREEKRRAGKKGAEARWGKPRDTADAVAPAIADAMPSAIAEPIAEKWQTFEVGDTLNGDVSTNEAKSSTDGEARSTPGEKMAPAMAPAMADGVAERWQNDAPLPLLKDLKVKSSSPPPTASGDRFDEFWQPYPRKADKQEARKAWAKAIKTTDPQTIIDGARRLADDPNLSEETFTPYGSTWLNKRRWEDPPLPPPRQLRAVSGDQSRAHLPEAWQ